jgi:glycosyltransferase involved in cell wall biosynthesis
MKKDKIEILIPTLNEEKNIESVLAELNNEGYYNITILDSHSSDKTVEIALKYNCKILLDPPKKNGFGNSLINGFSNLNSEYFCIFDGDNSFNPKAIEVMVSKIQEGYDFVFASRYKNKAISEDDDIFSKFGNYFFTKLVSFLFKINTTDVLFLYVVGKKKIIQNLELNQTDYSICTELILKAYKNFKCYEILSKERKRLYGSSKVNKVMASFTLINNIIKLYFRFK